ncbi:MAG: hypothetical protein Q8930_12735 [Bacillota bacterium]|nr:hypothetical protein [Bacillota bacterium]
MSHRKVVETYYSDMNNLADLLGKLVNSYRLLIGGVHELNGVALAHKDEIKDALDRVDELGKLIDQILVAFKYSGHAYIDYCKLKSDIIKEHLAVQYIQNEIDDELKLKE